MPVLDHKSDEYKFKELMLYVAKKSIDDSTFGATKLNKILCFSDFMVYGVTGEPLTGMAYQKLKWGPAPRQLKPLQRELTDERAAHVVRADYGYPQERLVPLRDPDLTRFTGLEISIVDSVMDQLKNLNATEVSRYSHRWFCGWEAASLYETIPYETVFWRQPEVTPDLIEEGMAVAARHGLINEGRE